MRLKQDRDSYFFLDVLLKSRSSNIAQEKNVRENSFSYTFEEYGWKLFVKNYIFPWYKQVMFSYKRGICTFNSKYKDGIMLQLAQTILQLNNDLFNLRYD